MKKTIFFSEAKAGLLNTAFSLIGVYKKIKEIGYM
jgi:hypothetical protein